MLSIESSTFGSGLRAMISEYVGRVSPLTCFYLAVSRVRRAYDAPLFRRRWKKLIHSIIEARRAAERTGAAATSSTCYPRHTGRMARTCSLMKYRQWSSQGTRQRPRHCSGCARCLPIRRNGKLTPQKHQGSSSRLKGPRQAFRGSVYLGSGTRDSSALSTSVCDGATGHAI
jgi:hypothetical protein